MWWVAMERRLIQAGLTPGPPLSSRGRRGERLRGPGLLDQEEGAGLLGGDCPLEPTLGHCSLGHWVTAHWSLVSGSLSHWSLGHWVTGSTGHWVTGHWFTGHWIH